MVEVDKSLAETRVTTERRGGGQVITGGKYEPIVK